MFLCLQPIPTVNTMRLWSCCGRQLFFPPVVLKAFMMLSEKFHLLVSRREGGFFSFVSLSFPIGCCCPSSQDVPAQERLYKSIRLWSFYVDLEESLGTVCAGIFLLFLAALIPCLVAGLLLFFLLPPVCGDGW